MIKLAGSTAARSKAKDVFVNYNPATGEAIGEVASGSADEVAQAVAQPRKRFQSGLTRQPRNVPG